MAASVKAEQTSLQEIVCFNHLNPKIDQHPISPNINAFKNRLLVVTRRTGSHYFIANLETTKLMRI